MTGPIDNAPSLERYARQIRYARLGEEGQRRLGASRVLICGCGALGSVAADILARAGVGHLRIVDRDFVETHNLQRQVLFDESDVAAGLPKAIAAAAKLRRINSEIDIEPIVADVTAATLPGLCANIDLILDGTDNFETRYLLNEAALKFEHTLGLRRRDRRLRPDDDHPAGRNSVPALCVARAAAAGKHAELRHGGHSRFGRHM